MTWHQVDESLRDNPIRGDAHPFDLAKDHFYRVQDEVDALVRRFHQMRSGQDVEFQGEAADAFYRTLDAAAKDLRDVPPVAHDIGWIFEQHANGLRELQARVDQALAHAIATRTQRDADRSRLTTSKATLSSIDKQIKNLRSAGTAESDPHLHQLVGQHKAQQTAVNHAAAAANQSQDALKKAVDQYHAFEHEQEQLEKTAAARFSNVNLRSLRDPNGLQRYLLNPIGQVLHDVAGVFLAIAHGDLDEFLWRLNDVLKVVGKVLAVITIVLTVLAAVGLAAVPGGLLLAALVVAAVSFAVTSTLWSRGSKNSETGRAMTGVEVIESGIDVALAAVGYRLGPVGTQGTHQLRDAGRFATPAIRLLHNIGDPILKFHDAWQWGHAPGEAIDGVEQASSWRKPVPDTTRLVPVPNCTTGPSRALMCPATY
jgi:hypothetical protein